MAVPGHIVAAKSLVTAPEATRSGFIAMALEKNAHAKPYIMEGRALRAKARQTADPLALLEVPELQEALLTASGLSDKALKHLGDADKRRAIEEFFDQYIVPEGDDYPDELLCRFLLTKGAALGGKMNNLVGNLGDKLFLEYLLAALRLRGRDVRVWTEKDGKKLWISFVSDAFDIESLPFGLEWSCEGAKRTLLLNKKVPLVDQNVDSILLSCSAEEATAKKNPFTTNPNFYLALGELKGGIDPAGADERWKTARSAIARISQNFAGEGLNPKTFFVGAAIATKMADQIFQRLQNGILANAANLSNDDQMTAFADWFVDL